MTSTDIKVAGANRAGAAFIALLVTAVFLFAGAALAQGPDPDRFIVKFAERGNSDAARQAINKAGASVLLEIPGVNAVAARIPAPALQGLRNNPNIELIEQDSPRFPMAQLTPYGIGMVQADQLAEAANGNVLVCVIDSGFDAAHEDFFGANVTGTNVPRSGGGTNFWDTDTCGHGTHVAGTVMAQNNDVGVVGVTPGVDLHIVKVFDGAECGWTYASSTLNAAYECADAGAKAGKQVVINMSLGCVDSGRGGPWANACSNSTDNNGFQDLYNNYGVLSVASAGNAGTKQKSYPASYASVISVAAIDENKAIAEFSQQNDAVELSGPGVGVLSTVPMGMGTVAEVAVNGTAYAADGMDGSAEGDASGAIVDCGRGTSVCAASGGKICLVERGDVSFSDKVLNCENGGGGAAIIYNNEPGALYGTLGGVATTIPSVGISQADGATILGLANPSGSVNVGVGHYASYNGTSMSSPHVAGVAALVWNHFPNLSNADIRQALQASAEDLGSAGRDNAFGYGLVQAHAAYTLLGGGDNGGGGQDPVNQPPTASFTSSCTELTCEFDGSASTDSDGQIASYSWNFGDGGTATGVTASRTYAAAGSYNVTLTVTDNAGATGGTSQVVTVAENVAGVIATATVSLSHVNRGPNTRTTATVTVTGGGAALGGATVSGCFSGAISACGTGTTNSNGQVSFDSGNYRGDPAGFCVTGVTGPEIDSFDSTGACSP